MLNKKVRKLTNLCLAQGSRLISLCWKDVKSPSVRLRLKELSSCLVLKLLNYMKIKSVEFVEIWNPFLVFLKNCEIEEIPET